MVRRRKMCIIVLTLIFFIIVSSSAGIAEDWPMHRHDTAQSGSTTPAPTSSDILWMVEDIGAKYTVPIVVDEYIYCFVDSPDGVKRFNKTTGEEDTDWFISLPIIPRYGSIAYDDSIAYDNGYLFLPGSNTEMSCYAIDDRSVRWSYQTQGSLWGPATVANGFVYFGDNDGNFHCIDASSGEDIWAYSKEGTIHASPAIVDDRVYIGIGKNMYCFDADPSDYIDEGIIDVHSSTYTYDMIWNFSDPTDSILSSPAVVDNKVFFGSGDNFWCVQADTGEILWSSIATDGVIISDPAVADGAAYISSIWGHLYSFDIDSEEYVIELYYIQPTWDVDLQGVNDGSSVIEADGHIIVGIGNLVYCLDTQGNTLWTQTTASEIFSTPILSDGYLYINTEHELYCLGELTSANQPPNKPAVPVGVTTGLVDVEYTFSTITTDSDGDPISYLFEWGDGTDSGWRDVSSATHQWSEEGSYAVRVKAKDDHELESEWSDTLTIHISPESSGEPDPTVEIGWVFGIATDTGPLEGVSICFIPDESTIGTCVITDEWGRYSIELPPGVYTITARKEGYDEYQFEDIQVQNGNATEHSFSLDIIEDPMEISSDITEQLLQLAIESSKEKETFGGEVIIYETTNTINTYRSSLSIDIVSTTKKEIKIQVADDIDSSPAIIALYIDKTAFDMSNIHINIDNKSVVLGDFHSLFSLQESEPKYGILLTNDGGYILVTIPSFSTHSLSIISVETVRDITSIIVYGGISIIVLFLFFSPLIVNLFRIQKGSKKK